MNPTPIILGAVAIIGATEASAQERARPAERATVSLKVSGMSCSVCAATVERVAKRVRGVVAATASQPRGTAEVTYDATATNRTRNRQIHCKEFWLQGGNLQGQATVGGPMRGSRLFVRGLSL